MSVDFYPGRFIPVSELPASVREFVGEGPVLSYIDGLDDMRLNMHNGGAASVLEALGFEVDPDECSASGHAEAEEFLGRVLMALAVAPKDEGCEAYDMFPGAPGATMWAAPRAEGDLQRRLGLLHDLASFCAERGFLVVWA